MASKIRAGARVRWADREYEVWSLSKRRGYVWLTRDGRTFEARVANCELVAPPATSETVREPAKVTQLRSAHNGPGKISETDRVAITAAFMADAADHDGVIDPNRVRAALSNDAGLTVPARALSTMYSSLAQRGVIRSLGFLGVNDDVRGGNAGKPQRHWQWVGPLPGQAVTA